jgi:hypothetical protein
VLRTDAISARGSITILTQIPTASRMAVITANLSPTRISRTQTAMESEMPAVAKVIAVILTTVAESISPTYPCLSTISLAPLPVVPMRPAYSSSGVDVSDLTYL